MKFATGKIIDNKYEVIKTIGQGGMGRVYLVKNINLDTLWAIKQLPKNQRVEIDLLVEPNIMKKLTHPSLPRVIDIIDQADSLLIVMDYVDGISLDKVLEKQGKIPAPYVIDWTKQIAEVLIYLHEFNPNPIIYRDMKPSNIMLVDEREIKIIDFGIAREYKETSDSDTYLLGTKGYAAPEQSIKGAQTDERTDIYSLGVTLYHLVTGVSPSQLLEFKPIREIDENLPEGLETILHKMLQADPANRYQTVREMLADFDKIEQKTVANEVFQRKRQRNIIATTISAFVFSYITFLGFTEMKAEGLEQYEQLVEQGNVQVAQHEFDQAAELYNKAIDQLPNESPAYLGLARTMYERGEYEALITYLTDTSMDVANLTEEPELFYLLGSAFYELEEYDQAVIEFKQAHYLSPNNEQYQLNLATSLAKNDELEKARDMLAQMKEDKPESGAVLYVDGEVLAASEELDKALKSFEKVLEVTDDAYLITKSTLAMNSLYKEHAVVLDDEDLSKRIELLQVGLEANDKEHDLLLTESLAESYYEKGIYENNDESYWLKSIQHFEKLLNRGYQRPYIYRNIAIIYQNMKMFKEAEATLMDMKKVYPEEYTTYLQLSFLYAEIENNKATNARDYSEVESNYELSLKYSPEGEATVELKPLKNLIDELRHKGWLD